MTTRELLVLGHDVRQVPPVYAKPFRQSRPTTRCVPAKTEEQLVCALVRSQ
jgi:transposase